MKILIFFACFFAPTLARAEWTPWQALADGHEDKVSFSVDYDRGRKAEEFFFYRFINNYERKVTFTVEFMLANGDKVERSVDGPNTLEPGETEQNKGLWSLGQIRSVKIISIRFGDDPEPKRAAPESISPDSGSSSGAGIPTGGRRSPGRMGTQDTRATDVMDPEYAKLVAESQRVTAEFLRDQDANEREENVNCSRVEIYKLKLARLEQLSAQLKATADRSSVAYRNLYNEFTPLREWLISESAFLQRERTRLDAQHSRLDEKFRRINLLEQQLRAKTH